MFITEVARGAYFLEAWSLKGLTNPPLVGMDSQQSHDFYARFPYLHVLVLDDPAESLDSRIIALDKKFEPVWFVQGDGTAAKRLREKGLKAYHLAPYKYFSCHGFCVMGIPSMGEKVSTQCLVSDGWANIWIQGKQLNHHEVARKLRVYLRRPITFVISQNPSKELRGNLPAYEKWAQGVLGARCEVLLLRADQPSQVQKVKEDLNRVDPRLHVVPTGIGYRRLVQGEPGKNRRISPWQVRERYQYQKKEFVPAPQRPVEVGSIPGVTNQQLEKYLERMVEVYIHRRFRKILEAEQRSVLHHLADRRMKLQIEVLLPGGKSRVWHFCRWAPRCEISFGPHPSPTYVFRYSATQILPYILGQTKQLPYEETRQSGGDIRVDGCFQPVPLEKWHKDNGEVWHPFYELKGAWKNSLENPFLTFKEKEKILYRF